MPSATKLVSLITGAGKGIGSATARLLASHNHHVVINFCKSETEAHKTAEACHKLGAETLLFKADISNPSECEALVQATIQKWGRVDNLINNAGMTVFSDYKDLKSQSVDVLHKILMTNLYGAYQLATCAAPHMQREGKGSIVNISSMAGITGIGSSIPYAVSKGALNTLTLSLAKALSPEICVNAICPGVVSSTWWNARFKEESKLLLFQKKQREASPINKIVRPEDVANAVLFLLENDHITGEIMHLNAGVHLGANPIKEKIPEPTSDDKRGGFKKQ
jgi:3-oxoacyl-[acyl-carrier protein] reductase